MTPIFNLIWFINITSVLDFLILEVSFLKAWDINLACKPIWLSPISPSISALGVKAATESITIRSTEFDLTSISVISKACSPVSGCDTRSSSTFTPIFPAYIGSNACSASIKAAVPPVFWHCATTSRVSVVLPEDSGP